MFYSCSEPILINEKDKIINVQIQPSKALELTNPYIEEHGTYDWNSSELRTYIVKRAIGIIL